MFPVMELVAGRFKVFRQHTITYIVATKIMTALAVLLAAAMIVTMTLIPATTSTRMRLKYATELIIIVTVKLTKVV